VLKAEIVEATANLHDRVADMVGAQPDVVLEDTTAFDRADTVLNSNPTLRNRTIVGFLSIR
jgi:hypothetical protein